MDDLFAVDDSEQAMHKQILEAIDKLCDLFDCEVGELLEKL